MNKQDERLLSALIDGEADDGELRGLLGPVDTAAPLSASLLRRHAILRNLSDAIRAHGRRHGAPLRLKMLPGKIAAGNAAPARTSWLPAWLDAKLVAAVLCTALLSVTVTTLVLRGGGNSEGLEAELVSMHLRSLMAPNPVDVASSDSHTVKPWFNGRIKYSPPVEDFAAQGFPLAGGRLEVIGAEPISALIYRHKQHLIDLYVVPARLGARYAALKPTQRDGFNILVREQGGFVFVAVSDLNPAELATLLQLAAPAR
jgi:anti-sigma factor RsiW